MMESDGEFHVDRIVLLGDWSRQLLAVAAPADDVANQFFLADSLQRL